MANKDPNNLETVKAEDYHEIFTDSSGISFNFFTFVITLGRFHGSVDGNINELKAAVLTAPEHAKALSKMLAGSISQYEQQFGAIRELGATIKSPIIVPRKTIVSQ